jgi:hypothetical protein
MDSLCSHWNTEMEAALEALSISLGVVKFDSTRLVSAEIQRNITEVMVTRTMMWL